MAWSFSIGRLLGSELRIHVTFFLLLGWVAYAAWVQGGPQAALANLIFIIALFVCVVAHEFGHAMAARYYGIRTPDITLLPFGGLARLERMPENPRHEIVVALAGPLVNVVIWAVLMLLGARPTPEAFDPDTVGRADLLAQLAVVNLLLALFNMLPAFPMDGGRVFRAALSLWMDRVRATRTAAMVGQALAVVLGFLGLSGGNPFLALIAVFVFFAASAESQDVAMRAVARHFRARDAMITSFEALAPGDSLDLAAATLLRTTQHEFPVLNPDGTLEGFVTRAALFRALADEHPRTRPAADIMQADIPRLALDAPLETVLEALHQGAPAVAVCDARHHLIGYITSENVGELMVVRGRNGALG